jgi:hypothetical protein
MFYGYHGKTSTVKKKRKKRKRGKECGLASWNYIINVFDVHI